MAFIKSSPKKRILCGFVFGILLIAALVFLIWYKIPYRITVQDTLIRFLPGDTDLYGDEVYVEADIQVQRNFFSQAVYTGTVSVNGDEYDDGLENINLIRTFSPLAVFHDWSSFTFGCHEWYGSKLITRLTMQVEDGRITDLCLKDSEGNSAGEYGKSLSGGEYYRGISDDGYQQ